MGKKSKQGKQGKKSLQVLEQETFVAMVKAAENDLATVVAEEKALLRALSEAEKDNKRQELARLVMQLGAVEGRIEDAQYQLERAQDHLEGFRAELELAEVLRNTYLDGRIPEEEAYDFYRLVWSTTPIGRSITGGRSELEVAYARLAPVFNSVFKAGRKSAK